VTRGSKVIRAVITTFWDAARGRSILRFFALEGREKEACMSSRLALHGVHAVDEVK